MAEAEQNDSRSAEGIKENIMKIAGAKDLRFTVGRTQR